jgi:hypothetical protein
LVQRVGQTKELAQAGALRLSIPDGGFKLRPRTGK